MGGTIAEVILLKCQKVEVYNMLDVFMNGYKTYSGVLLYVVVGMIMYLMPDLADEKLLVVMKDYVAQGLVGVGLVHKVDKYWK